MSSLMAFPFLIENTFLDPSSLVLMHSHLDRSSSPSWSSFACLPWVTFFEESRQQKLCPHCFTRATVAFLQLQEALWPTTPSCTLRFLPSQN